MQSSSTSRRLLAVPAALLMTGAVAVPSASAEPAVAVSFAAPQQVITFDTETPQTTSTPVAITGLALNEAIIGIDRRPANNLVYATTSARRNYTLDPATGALTPIGMGPFTAAFPRQTSGGVDFNPVPDRLRIVLPQDQNLRVNVDANTTTIDTPVAYVPGDVKAGANPHIAGSAYTNPDNDPMTGTALYDLDAVQDTLVLQSPPNDGMLNTLGPLGINIDNSTGFDISPSGVGYIVTNIPGDTASRLFAYPAGVGLGVSTMPVQVGPVGSTKLRYAHITVGTFAIAD